MCSLFMDLQSFANFRLPGVASRLIRIESHSIQWQRVRERRLTLEERRFCLRLARDAFHCDKPMATVVGISPDPSVLNILVVGEIWKKLSPHVTGVLEMVDRICQGPSGWLMLLAGCLFLTDRFQLGKRIEVFGATSCTLDLN